MRIPCAKAITWYLVAAMFLISVVPPADGGFVPSGMIAPSGIDRDADIDRIQRFIETKIVRERLAELNFTKEEITSRLAELSDAQLHDIATQIDNLKAGGDSGLGVVIAVLVIIILVIIIIRLLGRRVVVA